MSLSYSQCLIFLGSREDEKMRPPSKPNPRRLLGHSLHDFSGTTYEEAKALRAFTRTATVFVAGIRINASLSVAGSRCCLFGPCFCGFGPSSGIHEVIAIIRRPLPRCLRRIFLRSGGTRMKFEACKKATSGLSVACFGKTLAPPCLNSNRVISLRSLLPEDNNGHGIVLLWSARHISYLLNAWQQRVKTLVNVRDLLNITAPFAWVNGVVKQQPWQNGVVGFLPTTIGNL
ncbi:hypothetical protein JHK86_012464 [Glycine max]|nr:hypothetical protein JHK86_012464 [Glycine max]